MTDEVEVVNDESQPIENEVVEQEQSEEVTEESIEAKQEEIEKSKEETRNRRKERNNRRATAHIQKLEKQLQEMREEMAYMKGRQEQTQTNPEPNPDDFVTASEYRQALLDWADEQELPTDDHSEVEIQPEPQALQIDQELLDNYQSAGEERFGDEFLDMMEAAHNNEFACSPVMAESIFESEVGPELAMHLYDHPREAAKIVKLSPARQVREMLKLEAEFKKQPKQVSKAPRPITSEKGGNPQISDLSKPMDTAEYIRQRRAQLAK